MRRAWLGLPLPVVRLFELVGRDRLFPSAAPDDKLVADVGDASTIKRVEPAYLKAGIGKDAQITQVAASISHAKATTGMRSKSKWLPFFRELIWSNFVLLNDSALSANSLAFKQGYRQ